MGNYVSCKLANPLLTKNSRAIKVIFPTGEIRQIRHPIKAAELMMETPNFFIVDSKSLKIGRRFCPLHADYDLEKGYVYVMFSMQRKNSVVTSSDLAALFMTANSAVKRGISGGKVRIRPDNTDYYRMKSSKDGEGYDTVMAAVVPRLSFEGIEEVSTPEFRHRMSISRSKKPLLDTIDEEPVRLRSF